MKKILLLLAVVVQSGYAEKIHFEYPDAQKNQSTELEGSAIIDVITGDVRVTPTSEVLIVPSQAAVIGINADTYQAEVGDTVTVNWQIAYGQSCIGTVQTGSVVGWSGPLSSSVGTFSKSVIVNSFPATLRITCDNLDAYTQSNTAFKDLVISEVQDAVVSNPVINYLRANGSSNSTTITAAGNVNVSWSVSNSSSCTASSSPSNADWNHTFNPGTSSSKSVNITQSTTLALNCSGQTAQVQVILNNTIPSQCTTAVYPPSLSNISYTYAGLKDGNEFGATANGNILLDINTDDFASISFTSMGANTSRRLNFVTPPTTHNKTLYTSMSISECPGDFNVQTAACVKTLVAAQNPNVFITTKTGQPSTYCKLNPNTDYYLNFVNKQDPYSASAPVCKNIAHSSCAVFFSEGEVQ